MFTNHRCTKSVAVVVLTLGLVAGVSLLDRGQAGPPEAPAPAAKPADTNRQSNDPSKPTYADLLAEVERLRNENKLLRKKAADLKGDVVRSQMEFNLLRQITNDLREQYIKLQEDTRQIYQRMMQLEDELKKRRPT